MTFFKFSKTLSLADSFKNFKNFPCFRVFLDLKEVNRHNSGVHHQSACRLRCLITPLSPTSSLPCHLRNECTKQIFKFSMTFKNRQLYSKTFQAFHDLCEPCFTLWSSNYSKVICMYFPKKLSLSEILLSFLLSRENLKCKLFWKTPG